MSIKNQSIYFKSHRVAGPSDPPRGDRSPLAPGCVPAIPGTALIGLPVPTFARSAVRCPPARATLLTIGTLMTNRCPVSRWSGDAVSERCRGEAASERSRCGVRGRPNGVLTRKTPDVFLLLFSVQYKYQSYLIQPHWYNDPIHIVFHPCNPAPLRAGQVQIISLASLHLLCLITVHRPSRSSSHVTTISFHSVHDKMLRPEFARPDNGP